MDRVKRGLYIGIHNIYRLYHAVYTLRTTSINIPRISFEATELLVYAMAKAKSLPNKKTLRKRLGVVSSIRPIGNTSFGRRNFGRSHFDTRQFFAYK